MQQHGWVKGSKALEGVLWRVPLPLHPSKSQRSELFFHPSFEEGAKVDRGPTEGGARGHHDRLGAVWPTRFILLWEEVVRGKGRRPSRQRTRTWQRRGSPEKQESSGFQVRGRVAGAREGRGLLLPLTCRAKAKPQQRG